MDEDNVMCARCGAMEPEEIMNMGIEPYCNDCFATLLANEEIDEDGNPLEEVAQE